MNYYLFISLFFLKYLGLVLKKISKEELEELHHKIKIFIYILRGVFLGLILGIFLGGFIFYLSIAIAILYSIFHYAKKWSVFPYLDTFVTGLMFVLISIFNPNMVVLTSIMAIVMMLDIVVCEYNLKSELISMGLYLSIYFLIFVPCNQ